MGRALFRFFFTTEFAAVLIRVIVMELQLLLMLHDLLLIQKRKGFFLGLIYGAAHL